MLSRPALLGIVLLLSITLVGASDFCGWEVDPGVNCEEQTGVLGSCSVYNVTIFNSSHVQINDTRMGQIGNTGIYWFNFSTLNLGVAKWVACDNSTGTINVKTSIRNLTGEILFDTGEIQGNQSLFCAGVPKATWDYTNRNLTWFNNTNWYNSTTWFNNSAGASITAADIQSIKNAVLNESITCSTGGWKNQSNASSIPCALWSISRRV